MKIFLIIPTLKQGGAERVIAELANGFVKQKRDVHLVLLAQSDDFYRINPEIQIHRLGFRNRGRLKKIVAELRTFHRLRKLFKNQNPDIVLSFMGKYNIFSILASGFLKLNIFISDRSSPEKRIPKHIYLLKRLTYKYATGIIAQTHLSKNTLQITTKNKNIKVIPNPVKPVRLFSDVKREQIILNVGRLVPEKGQKYLIEAFEKIKALNWKLVILGDGPLKTDLFNQSKKLKIDHQIVMPGTVKNIDEWLARASIFAFSSVSEGFPNALAEAMTAGLPCISFDCNAGPKDLIKDGENGFLVPVYDVSAFSQKLKYLIDHNEIRSAIGMKAKYSLFELNINNIIKKYSDFLFQK